MSEPKAKSIRCTNCGHDNLANATICLVCDSPLTFTSRFSNSKRKPTGLLPPTEEELRQEQEELERLNKANQSYHASQDNAQNQSANNSQSPPRKTGVKCEDCGHVNRVGDLFCIECGANILSIKPEESAADVTQQINELKAREHQETYSVHETSRAVDHAPSNIDIPALKSVAGDIIPSGCFQFTNDMRLRFTDIQTGRYIEVSPSKDKPLLVGRSHASLPIQPEIDLTPFLMEQHGVSRRHALIRLRDLRLEIQDLDSTNGTGINGFRFQTKETHQLRNGDVITLGRVSIKVIFLRKDAPSGKHVTERLDA